MKLKLIASVLVLMVALTGVLGATAAYFSDYETSIGNTFTAGKLDLKVNDRDGNVSLFELVNLSPSDFDESDDDDGFDLSINPGTYPSNAYKITNAGTITGYLNIKKVTVTNYENGLTDPEKKYGDATGGELEGELGAHLRTVIFIDENNNRVYDDGETVLFGRNTYSDGVPRVDGTAMNKLNDPAVLATLSTLNYKLEPNEDVAIVGVITRWYRSGNNNEAQSDSVTLDLVFTLDQKTINQNPLPTDLKVAPNYSVDPAV